MSIEIHCPKCSKLIRAPDTAGGRHGKCPYCDNSVYVPMPPDAGEEIGLAPVDENELREEEKARREAVRLAAMVDHAKEGRGSDGTKGARPTSASRRDVPGEVVDIGLEIKHFILAMRNSKLEEAERAVDTLKKTGARARDHAEGLLLDEIPPKFEDVPAALVKGFLKTLVGRLS